MKTYISGLVILLTVAGCIPYPLGSQGLCTIDDTTINTYKLYGTWKRTDLKRPEAPDGYDPATPAKFQLRYFENGGIWFDQDPFATIGGEDVILNSRMCRVQWNSRPAYALDIGQFDPNLPTPGEAAFRTFPAGSDGTNPTDEIVNYSFSGTCSDTNLTVEHSTGVVETYSVYNYDPNTIIGICQPPAP